MPTARTKANRKYNEKAYDRISITIPKGRKQELEQYVKEHGEDSINGFTNRLYMEHLGIDKKDWKPKQSDESS